MASNAVQWALEEASGEDHEVLIDAERSARGLTRKKVRELVERLAGAFEEGSVVCVHAANDVLYPILVLAILASGCTYTGSNPVYSPKELKHHVEVSGAKYVFTTTDLLKNVEPVVDEVGSGVQIIIFSDLFRETAPATESSHRALHDMINHSLGDLFTRLGKIKPDSIATLMATSGTTGLPKLAARSHAALLAEVQAIANRTANQTYEVRKLIGLPIYHAFAFPELTFNALRQGHPTYILKRFGDSFSYRIRDHEITEILGSPSMLLELEESASGDIDIKADLQTLKKVYCGGAPLAKELKDRFVRLFHEAPRLINVYGMTECGWISVSEDTEHEDTSCVGTVLDGLEVNVNQSTATTLTNGQEVGELGVKGTQLMIGYKNDRDATDESIRLYDWLETGDVGYVKDNKLHLVDRAKGIIKIDGFSVSPTEFEYALRDIWEVKDVAVISSGPGSLDEYSVVFISKRQGEGELTSAKVKQHLTSRLSRYKVAKVRVRFVESIPREKDGRVLSEELRNQL